MKYYFSLKYLLGFGFSFCIVVFIVFQITNILTNDVVINNRSGMQIKTVQVIASDSIRIIGPIESGESARISFGFITQDCDIEISVEFEDSTKLSAAVGYLSHTDFNTLHEVTVTENSIVQQPARRRRFLSRK